ncbi:hypothetical protein [Leuconostoc falkenbergense]|jgi:hypothetical protein|uniref:hypothetical protein n=1 Tax=Leuconostoc falkenbergense TaxID=2766470 RepID=UPI002958DD1B|nr:hypothetical protein [Leuconostoc falkenbergense]
MTIAINIITDTIPATLGTDAPTVKISIARIQINALLSVPTIKRRESFFRNQIKRKKMKDVMTISI